MLRGGSINTEPIKKLSKQKQQFVEGHEVITKTLNLAIRTDSVDELIGLCHRFMTSHAHLNAQQTNESCQNDFNGIGPSFVDVRGLKPESGFPREYFGNCCIYC